MKLSTCELPKKVVFVLERLENAGHSAYIVGGCVRDILLGKVPMDFDIATSAMPHEVKSLFDSTVDIGIRHGTVSVLVQGEKIEVTTYRIDGEYADGRRPSSVSFTGDIVEDLSRRDFTVNAIAYNPKHGFVDPFFGQNDIQGRLIKCVGSPHERFCEDALRMVRAVRFASTLGFDVDKSLVEAISCHREKLELVSVERIGDELRKLLLGCHPEALFLAEQAGILPHILRGGDLNTGNLAGTIRRIKDSPADFPLRLAVLLDGICENNADVLAGLKLSGKTSKAVQSYLSYMHAKIEPNKYELKKVLRNLPEYMLDILLEFWKNAGHCANLDELIRQKSEIVQGGECYSLDKLAISGQDLIAAGIKPGREMGGILESLLDDVMREPGLNDRDSLLGRVLQAGH